MICKQCQEHISDYIDGLLELGEQVKIERHLADCEPCRAVRDDLLQIVHFSHQLPEHAPSGALWARIQSDIAEEQPAGFLSRAGAWWAQLKTRNFNLSIPQMVASAAALALDTLGGRDIIVALLYRAAGDPVRARAWADTAIRRNQRVLELQRKRGPDDPFGVQSIIERISRSPSRLEATAAGPCRWPSRRRLGTLRSAMPYRGLRFVSGWRARTCWSAGAVMPSPCSGIFSSIQAA